MRLIPDAVFERLTTFLMNAGEKSLTTGLSEASELKSLTIFPADIICIRSSHRSERNFADYVKSIQSALSDAGFDNMLIITNMDSDLELLNEDRMRQFGWVRSS